MASSKLITSTSNLKIKNVIRLRDRKERARTGLTIVEGFREVARADEAGVKFEEFYYCPKLIADVQERAAAERISLKSILSFETTEQVFGKIAFGERFEGVLGVCRQPSYKLGDLKLSANPFIVIVERIEKPGNLGAILRTCDAAGVDGLIVSEGATDIYNPNVIRASIGTVFSVKPVASDSRAVFEFLKKANIKVFVASPEAQMFYTKASYADGLAIVLGSEEKGVSDFWTSHADKTIKIPMLGVADSLNVSTAAAVLIFEAVRQRGFSAKGDRLL
jgi:TrmH family RNA methyltransferase